MSSGSIADRLIGDRGSLSWVIFVGHVSVNLVVFTERTHPDTLGRLLVDHCVQQQPPPRQLALLSHARVQLDGADLVAFREEQEHQRTAAAALLLSAGPVDDVTTDGGERIKRRKVGQQAAAPAAAALGGDDSHCSTETTKTVCVAETQELSLRCKCVPPLGSLRHAAFQAVPGSYIPFQAVPGRSRQCSRR